MVFVFEVYRLIYEHKTEFTNSVLCGASSASLLHSPSKLQLGHWLTPLLHPLPEVEGMLLEARCLYTISPGV